MMVEDPRALIRRAFQMAREQGKPARMTIAVLKNRMLTLSDREFDEKKFGASSFREFLEAHPDLVRIDTATRIPAVEFVEDIEAVEHVPVDGRIRQDLWNSIMDYSSGKVYAWDPVGQAAVHREDAPQAQTLPTLTKEEMDGWRLAFVNDWKGSIDNDDELHFLLEWHAKGLTTYALPRDLQGRWNRELKKRVALRLREWFRSTGNEEPDSLIVSRKERRPRPLASSLALLRATVIECVRQMTADEISELRLPPTAVLRARTALSKLRD